VLLTHRQTRVQILKMLTQMMKTRIQTIKEIASNQRTCRDRGWLKIVSLASEPLTSPAPTQRGLSLVEITGMETSPSS